MSNDDPERDEALDLTAEDLAKMLDEGEPADIEDLEHWLRLRGWPSRRWE